MNDFYCHYVRNERCVARFGFQHYSKDTVPWPYILILDCILQKRYTMVLIRFRYAGHASSSRTHTVAMRFIMCAVEEAWDA